jgi:hypothetical protein
MGFTKAEESQLEEEFIWPSSCARHAFTVSSVAHDEKRHGSEPRATVENKSSQA